MNEKNRYVDCHFYGHDLSGKCFKNSLFHRCNLIGVLYKGSDFSGSTLCKCWISEDFRAYLEKQPNVIIEF